MRTWADSYTQAVRQRTGCQETTMAKTGTLPHYLYSNKISEVARTTETYSADTFRSSGVENEVPDMTDQDEVPEVKSTEEEEAGQFDSASEQDYDLLPTSASTVTSLDEGSLFLVSRSTRFGRSFKINSRFLS